jgi:hypothetical protein
VAFIVVVYYAREVESVPAKLYIRQRDPFCTALEVDLL